MTIVLNREKLGEDYTEGRLFIDGQYLCDTLEDKVRQLESGEKKVMHRTAIPAGRYKVVLSYSIHFQQQMPELVNVPYFSHIRIHWGNSTDDTSGCILVGERSSEGKLIRSKVTYKKLMDVVKPVFQRNEEINMEVVDLMI